MYKNSISYKMNNGKILQITITSLTDNYNANLESWKLNILRHLITNMSNSNYVNPKGEMTILDNVRCQHAREAFEGNESARHLVTTFMAWDEALCRRRRLQEKFNNF